MGSIGSPETIHDSTVAHGGNLLNLAAGRLRQISAGKFSAEVRQKAAYCLLDFLGAAQYGLTLPVGQIVVKYSALRAGNPEAFVFGGEKGLVSAETAAFTNTVLAHWWVCCSPFLQRTQSTLSQRLTRSQVPFEMTCTSIHVPTWAGSLFPRS